MRPRPPPPCQLPQVFNVALLAPELRDADVQPSPPPRLSSTSAPRRRQPLSARAWWTSGHGTGTRATSTGASRSIRYYRWLPAGWSQPAPSAFRRWLADDGVKRRLTAPPQAQPRLGHLYAVQMVGRRPAGAGYWPHVQAGLVPDGHCVPPRDQPRLRLHRCVRRNGHISTSEPPARSSYSCSRLLTAAGALRDRRRGRRPGPLARVRRRVHKRHGLPVGGRHGPPAHGQVPHQLRGQPRPPDSGDVRSVRDVA